MSCPNGCLGNPDCRHAMPIATCMRCGAPRLPRQTGDAFLNNVCGPCGDEQRVINDVGARVLLEALKFGGFQSRHDETMQIEIRRIENTVLLRFTSRKKAARKPKDVAR